MQRQYPSRIGRGERAWGLKKREGPRRESLMCSGHGRMDGHSCVSMSHIASWTGWMMLGSFCPYNTKTGIHIALGFSCSQEIVITSLTVKIFQWVLYLLHNISCRKHEITGSKKGPQTTKSRNLNTPPQVYRTQYPDHTIHCYLSTYR